MKEKLLSGEYTVEDFMKSVLLLKAVDLNDKELFDFINSESFQLVKETEHEKFTILDEIYDYVVRYTTSYHDAELYLNEFFTDEVISLEEFTELKNRLRKRFSQVDFCD